MLPRYGERSLAEVLTSVAARLGLAGVTDALGLPPAAHYVVVLVDGLGYRQLGDHGELAPYLAGRAAAAEPLTAPCPATTATSISCLGTGLTPGQHGVVGYRFRLGRGEPVFSPLSWDIDAHPDDIQPHATVFERLTSVGLVANAVTLARFAGSGLTQLALRGATVLGFDDESDLDLRVALTLQGIARGAGVTYVYERRLDHDGHGHGVDSPYWRARLGEVDRLCRRLRDELPADVPIVVTGDHGMVDVPSHRHVVIEDEPELGRGLVDVGGEGRFRHLYTADPAGVAARWAAALGERAWVATRAEAVEAGWFGAVAPRLLERFGDVVVAARGDTAVMTRALPGELGLIGMHGSLTAAEMLVPFCVD